MAKTSPSEKLPYVVCKELPECPWCGTKIEDFYEYGGMLTEDGAEWECWECEQPLRTTCYISYSFNTHAVDVEAEKKAEDKREREAEHRRLVRLRAAEQWKPGDRVRIRADNPRFIHDGKTATVANRELSKHNPFVHLDLNERYEHSGKPVTTFVNGDELERA